MDARRARTQRRKNERAVARRARQAAARVHRERRERDRQPSGCGCSECGGPRDARADAELRARCLAAIDRWTAHHGPTPLDDSCPFCGRGVRITDAGPTNFDAAHVQPVCHGFVMLHHQADDDHEAETAPDAVTPEQLARVLAESKHGPN